MTVVLTTSLLQAKDSIISTLFSTPFETVMLIFSFILTVKTIINIYSYTRKYYQQLKYINQVDTSNVTKDIQTIIKKTQKKINKYENKLIIIHPITLLMYTLYINDLV